jgi:DNA-binding protein Fis
MENNFFNSTNSVILLKEKIIPLQNEIIEMNGNNQRKRVQDVGIRKETINKIYNT